MRDEIQAHGPGWAGEAIEPGTRFTVALQGPLDLAASLEGFHRWGDDLVDRWDGRTLLRTTRADGQVIAFACTVAGSVEAPALEVAVADARHRPAVEAAVQGMFVQAPAALATLCAIDPLVARLEQRFPGTRPVLQLDLLTALIRAISAQQVNLRWAATTRRRLAEAFGTRHIVAGREVYSFDPERLAGLAPAALRALQFTTRKAEYLVATAAEVASGRLDLARLRELPDEAVIERITALRGLGRWTADWLLARTLGRPRVAAGDLGVRKAVGLAYAGGRLLAEQEVRELTAHWGAAAGVAQQLLLHALAHDPHSLVGS